MTVSFFAGPEHIETATEWLSSAALALPQIQLLAVSGQRNFWTGAGGVSYIWNGMHTGLTANVIRTVSNGGGLLGAVTLTSADAAFRRQLSRGFTASLGMNYGQSDSLGAVITSYSSLKSATGSLSLTRQVTQNLEFTVGYARAYQQEGGSGSGISGVDHNRAWASILYQFSRPLGR